VLFVSTSGQSVQLTQTRWLMSRMTERSLQGPVDIVPAPVTLTERLSAMGIAVPDQHVIGNMMRAAQVGLRWGASEEKIVEKALEVGTEDFRVFSLIEYSGVDNGTYGFPMPHDVKDHVADLQQKIPEAEIRIHAVKKDDPFVEVTLGNESVFTMAWWRDYQNNNGIYPTKNS
jgi:hypothetical protein